MAILPVDGSPRPNAELRKQLGVSDDEYWRVRNGLLEEGRVTKSPGRGGRTALAVAEDYNADKNASTIRPWMVAAVFSLAVATLLIAIVYAVASWGSDRLVWDLLALSFGAVSMAAVGVSLLIYKVQTDAARLETEGQARILKRLEVLTRQAALSSSDARDLLQTMAPAVKAASSEEAISSVLEAPDDIQGAPSEELEQPSAGASIRTDQGTYYGPPAIPLKVISDLVRWWDGNGETGRWDLSTLVGGFRAFNNSGNHTGVPWMLTFRSGEVQTRSFRVAYSGRRTGPSVSELADEGIWHDFEGTR